jgi:micrococcal nuclease
MAIELYNYKATCIRVIDGDTIVCNIDMGFYTQLNDQIVRLARINAPELPTTDGIKSKDFLKNIIEGKEIVIKTEKEKNDKDKYGRWIGEVFFNCENLNDKLVKENLAEYHKY